MFDGRLHIRQAFYSRELMPLYADQFTRCGLQSSASSALIHFAYTQYNKQVVLSEASPKL